MIGIANNYRLKNRFTQTYEHTQRYTDFQLVFDHPHVSGLQPSDTAALLSYLYLLILIEYSTYQLIATES